RVACQCLACRSSAAERSSQFLQSPALDAEHYAGEYACGGLLTERALVRSCGVRDADHFGRLAGARGRVRARKGDRDRSVVRGCSALLAGARCSASTPYGEGGARTCARRTHQWAASARAARSSAWCCYPRSPHTSAAKRNRLSWR